MNMVFSDAFAGRSVFVTGHTGFKGSWLCLWLNHAGARVTGYALTPPTEPNNFTVSGVGELLARDYRADIRNASSLQAALHAAAPDVIFHLAAQSVVSEGYRSPRETFDVNVMGTASVLEAVRRLHKPCVVVVVTSDKCYENREQAWGYRESDPFGDYDPYGASKGAAEILIRSYRHSFFHPARLADHGVKVASARAGNVVGGGDWTHHALVVDIMRALSEGRPIRLRNPRSSRPWQHVLQALSGYLTLATRLLESDDPDLCAGWNFGPFPGNELCVRRVTEQLIQEWGGGSWKDISDGAQPHEATILRLAIDKALWQLRWSPCWNIRETLQRTVEWYRQFSASRGSMRGVSLQQIAAYEAALASRAVVAGSGAA